MQTVALFRSRLSGDLGRGCERDQSARLEQIQQVQRADDVRSHCAQRLRHVQRRRSRRRKVEDLVEAEVRTEVLDIRLHEMQPPVPDVVEVLAQAGPEVVDDIQRGNVTPQQQPVDQMRPNEAAAAGNQDSRHA